MKNKQKNPVKPRDFSDEEIIEINKYIIANVPYSILQTTLPVTENALQKARVYTIVYRFINGAKNYVANKKTKDKLIKLLKENKELYEKVYNLVLDIDNNTVMYYFEKRKKLLVDVYKDFENNFTINNFIDIFLVFAEKQSLINLDEVTGFNLETEEGREAYRKLMGEKKED